jgi:hypothetical protein
MVGLATIASAAGSKRVRAAGRRREQRGRPIAKEAIAASAAKANHG